jgi:hypothetical protein
LPVVLVRSDRDVVVEPERMGHLHVATRTPERATHVPSPPPPRHTPLHCASLTHGIGEGFRHCPPEHHGPWARSQNPPQASQIESLVQRTGSPGQIVSCLPWQNPLSSGCGL